MKAGLLTRSVSFVTGGLGGCGWRHDGADEWDSLLTAWPTGLPGRCQAVPDEQGKSRFPVVGGPVGEVRENAAARDEHGPQPSQEIDSPRRRAGGTDCHGRRRCDSPGCACYAGSRELPAAGMRYLLGEVVCL